MKLLKKWSVLFVCVCLLIFGCSCGQKQEHKADENTVVIRPSDEVLLIESDTTLMDYLFAMQEKDMIELVVENGMILSVGGIENETTGLNSMNCWMLYTSDPDNSNAAFGVLEYDGEKYASASWGAESLVIKKEFVYILAYHEVTW